MTIAYTAPILLGGFFAGPLLDRFTPRRVMLADNLISLDASRVRSISAGYQLAGLKNLVRVFYADYDQDNSRYLEARDDQAVAAWGEAAVDVDLRYDAPVVLENPEVAELLATRLLKRLSSP